MRRYLLLSILNVTCLLALAFPAMAQSGTAPHLHITDTRELGELAADDGSPKTAILRVFFRAYRTEAMDFEYTGLVKDLTNRIQVNGRNAPIVGGPRQVDDASEPVPLVFLLAIDVSGSMGSHQSDQGQAFYAKRMAPVRQALEGFIQGIDSPAVFARLYPWAHEVPFPIKVEGGDQQLQVWENQYLPLDNQGRIALMQGIRDIDTFVRTGERNVHTALYGACLKGAKELGRIVKTDPRFPGAKPVVIILTDGENDPVNASPEIRSLKLSQLVQNLEELDPAVPVYTIGFGLGSSKAESDLHQIADAAAAKSHSLADGSAASLQLQGVYEEVLEIEGNSWYVDIDSGMSRTDIGRYGARVTIVEGSFERVDDRMLLVPSALIKLTPKFILYSLVIGAVVLIILANIWFFTRPKEEFFADDDSRGGDMVEDEVEVEKADSSGAGVKRYLDKWKEEEDT